MATILWFDVNFWLLLVPVSLAIIGLTVHFYIIHTHLRAFPTPPLVPVFGHVFDYTDPYYSLTKLTKNLIQYGGIIRQFIGPRKPGLVTSNRDFLEFLCNNNKYVRKAKYYRYMQPWLGEGLITSDGAKWLSRRKALTSSFTQTAVLRNFAEIFEQKGDLLIGVFENFQGGKVDLHPIMKRFTLDVICETAMGVSLDSQLASVDTIYAKSVETICEVIQNRMTSFLKNFDFFFQFSQDCFREKEGLAVVDGMLERIIAKKIEDKRTKSEQKPRKDLLDLLMEVEIDGRALSSDDLREEINTFTFAGYDTTSSAMSLALYEIAENPDIQEKLLEEQKRVFENDFERPLVTYEKLEEMRYLEMVIKETLRLHTIVPCVGKKVTKDLKYGDITIPSMLNISVCIYAFHHHPDYFSNPDKFRPERFADGSKIDKFTYIPFGVKPRQCLGKNFAMLEMKSALSKIIRNFEMSKVPDRKIRIQHKLVLFSSNGIWVSMQRRNNTLIKSSDQKT